jgi:hypothetical protein
MIENATTRDEKLSLFRAAATLERECRSLPDDSTIGSQLFAAKTLLEQWAGGIRDEGGGPPKDDYYEGHWQSLLFDELTSDFPEQPSGEKLRQLMSEGYSMGYALRSRPWPVSVKVLETNMILCKEMYADLAVLRERALAIEQEATA